MRVILTLLALASVLLLSSCVAPETEVDADTADPLAVHYPKTPEPGIAVFYPPAPLFPPLEGDNLLSDPGFESGLTHWRREGSEKECYSFDTFSAEGRICCRALAAPSKSLFVYQPAVLTPRTFYLFDALVFSVGESEVIPEARNSDSLRVVKGQVWTGPAKIWERITLTFVTGRERETVAVGLNCVNTGKDSPVLIDHCSLHTMPTSELLEGGSAEFELQEEQAPIWYLNGRPAVPVSPGYMSEHALELPGLQGKPSRLFGFLFPNDGIWGRALWVSAMVKINPQETPSPPEVILGLRLTASSAQNDDWTGSCLAAGDWREVNLLVNLPELNELEPNAPAPFPVVVFERPPGVEGTVLVDDVSISLAPEDGFDGALVPLTRPVSVSDPA